ncbi:MAG: (2Fe-2S) ferredoxin domain-containing protein [Spirochaetes bacterium]|nr:(2Fe-2S) ferredoxin domain-containing protein [Spirochaetota bacterium]
MIETTPRHRLYIQVCEHVKPGVQSCGAVGAPLREQLKARVAALGLAKEIRVMKSGCFGVCEEGPNVFLFPHGVWFHHVGVQDLEDILQRARSLAGV